MEKKKCCHEKEKACLISAGQQDQALENGDPRICALTTAAPGGEKDGVSDLQSTGWTAFLTKRFPRFRLPVRDLNEEFVFPKSTLAFSR